MTQLICPATGKVRAIERDVPAIGPGEALVKMNLCGVCGTDVEKVYADSVAKPVALGHELVGTIVDLGKGVTNLRVGQRIAALHHVPDRASHLSQRGSATMDAQFRATNYDPCGFAEFVRLSPLHVQHAAQPLPDALTDERAVFAEPLCCVLRAFDRVSMQRSDTVLLIGAGAVGLLFLPLIEAAGAQTIAVDLRQERVELARAWGAAAAHASTEEAGAIVESVRQSSNGRGADLVVLTVVNKATMTLACASLRVGGTLLLFGAKSGTLLTVDLWWLWRSEINVISSYGATPDLLPRAVALLGTPRFAFERTISHTFSLAQGARAFELMHSGDASKVVIGA